MFEFLNSLSALQVILLCAVVSLVGSFLACAIASGNNISNGSD